MSVPTISPIEIACDESGFTGGNLTFRHTVFAHASLRIEGEVAREEMARLRRRVAAHGELKASWLLRWCDGSDLRRLLGPGGVLGGPEGLLGARVRVHLTDIRFFLLTRLADVLLGSHEVSGLDLPGEDPVAREPALQLHVHGEEVFGIQRWQAFLTAAGNALRTNSRWVPDTAVSDFESSLGELATAPAPPRVQEALRLLRSAAGRARSARRSQEDDPRRSPLLEPLLPALNRAVLRWGADHPSLVVVHDEQSALTPWRIADIAQRLALAHPGHVVDLIRVDSRDDPRVQIADLVAGIARRAAVSMVIGRPDTELIELVRPLVDPRSIWPDGRWSEDPRSDDQISPQRRAASPRDDDGRLSARPA